MKKGHNYFLSFFFSLLIITCFLFMGCDVFFSNLAAKDGNGGRAGGVRTVTFDMNDGSGEKQVITFNLQKPP